MLLSSGCSGSSWLPSSLQGLLWQGKIIRLTEGHDLLLLMFCRLKLGMLVSAEAAHGVAAQLAKDAKDMGVSDGNAGIVAGQLENQHIPTGLNNVRGALEQYSRYLAPSESPGIRK